MLICLFDFYEFTTICLKIYLIINNKWSSIRI